ncbi:MAG: hypothetical protein ACPL25_10150 [Ignavibacteria bacterium]
MRKSFLLITAVLLITTFYTSELFGIPAFARKYSMSCQTCHSPFPRLKDYGDQFARNGFVLVDKDAPRYFQETGDAELSLIRDFPLALRIEAFATFKHKSNEDRIDFATPYMIKFLSGGALTKNVSYYFYLYLNEKGEITSVEDAYLMFNNVFNTDLDIYIGQFQISDPLFKRELRLTREDYMIYKKKIGDSKMSLGYDRGIMLNLPLKTKTDLTFEIVNGNGLGPVSDNFDIDKYPSFFGRISQDLADPLRLGLFGYYGKEKINSNPINKATMFGVDATISLSDKFNANFQYVNRKDSKADTLRSANTNGSFIELIYTPKGDDSKWYAAALINYINSDNPDSDYKTVALHSGYLLRRNIRLYGELIYNFINKSNQLIFGIVTGF